MLTYIFIDYDADALCKLRHGILANIRSKDISGWLYPKNSMLKRLFDKFLLNINEKGIEREIFLKYFVSIEKDLCNVQTKPIQYHIVSTLFNVLISGCILSLIILFIEKIFQWTFKSMK